MANECLSNANDNVQNANREGTAFLELDAVVVGAGFGGIYQLKKLRDQGLNVRAIDTAGDVGGTWWWNQYPGAMSDTEAYLYRYSWAHDDLLSYKWTKHYVYQKEVLGYLQHVTRKYLVTALGLLLKQNFPNIPGIDSYEGEKYHTGAWPSGVELKGKRVGVIGNGSTGVQVITEIAKDVDKLVSFQRNPQYSVLSGQGDVSPEYRQQINDNYEQIWEQVKDGSQTGFGFKENDDRPTMSVDAQCRNELFEAVWRRGGGFRFMVESFNDISTNEEANKEACKFIKAKIRATVKDEDTARKLLPAQLYARRPLCDAGYYEQFNRDNVEVVSFHETPIEEITPRGIKTADGKEYELDVMIFATGFDAVDGNYTRVRIRGRDGMTLKDKWGPAGPTSYLGMAVHDFPNMFMILGPNGPFCNIPPAIETEVEFISDVMADTERKKRHDSPSAASATAGPVIEATVDAEEHWTKECDETSKDSLFRKTDSWIFGANVPGKAHAVMFYFGGLAKYRQQLRDFSDAGWKGFTIG